VQKVVILAMPRTGSNLLQTTLECHPDVHFHGEIYSPKKAWGVRMPLVKKILKSVGTDLTAWRDDDPIRFLDWVFEFSPKKRVVGFKMLLHHSPIVIDRLIADTEIKLIILERENRLATFSSYEIAKMTSVWHTIQDQPKAPLITFNSVAFDRHCALVDDTYASINGRLKGRPNVLNTTYTEVASGVSTDAILNFLGLRAGMALTSKLKKQNPSKPIERFENHFAVEQYLEQNGKQSWAFEGE
jgi:hypothetical protein